MNTHIRIYPWVAALAAVFILTAMTTTLVLASGNIDPNYKYAWGTNIGWINFNTASEGVEVYIDHLEGYAWSENIGWIRLGAHVGGGAHTYTNTTSADYGVNRAPDGQLSGYAWSATAGWINFNPNHGGVTIDPFTGLFEGYAWGENVGWIGMRTDHSDLVTQFVLLRAFLPVVVR